MKPRCAWRLVLATMILGIAAAQERTAAAQIPNTTTDILPIEVKPFPPAEKSTATHLGGDVNGLLGLVDQLPEYIVWGCAGGSPNNLWFNPRKDAKGVTDLHSMKLTNVTCTEAGPQLVPASRKTCTLTFSAGEWKPALVFVNGGEGGGGGKMVTFTGSVTAASCVPYLILFP